MVDVFLHDDLVVAVSIHYNIYIIIRCFLILIGFSICRCLVTVIRKLLCDIFCIHEGCFAVYRTIFLMTDLIWCCFLQACDGCFSIPIRKYG